MYALAFDSSGNLYAGGVFSTAGGNPANRIARWDGSAWSALGTGVDGRVRALAVGSSGNLYAGGEFSTAGGEAANRVAVLRGAEPVSSGESQQEPDGTPAGSAGGTFPLANGALAIVPPGAVPDGSSLWANIFAHPGADSSGAYPLTFAIDIVLKDANGSKLTSFSPPLEVCLPVTDAMIAKAGGAGGLLLAWRTSMDDGRPWTFLPTVVKEVAGYGQMACASLNHLTVFTVMEAQSQALPQTGFQPGVVTDLGEPASDYFEFGSRVGAFRETPLQGNGMTLEIPRLGVTAPIVGVPETTAGWDVAWLGDSVGWLEGTAFPTWEGNSVLTGHVYDADGLPGVFANLRTLWWGDRIVVRAWGEEHRYAVRSVRLVDADDETWARHDEQDWLTLVTCRGFDEKTGEYRWRTVVRAVRVE